MIPRPARTPARSLRAWYALLRASIPAPLRAPSAHMRAPCLRAPLLRRGLSSALGGGLSPKSLRSAHPLEGASKSLGECKTSTGDDLNFPQNRINCLSWSICNSAFREDFCWLQPRCTPKICSAEAQNRGLFR